LFFELSKDILLPSNQSLEVFTSLGGFSSFNFGLSVFSFSSGEESSLGRSIGLGGFVNSSSRGMSNLGICEFSFSLLEGSIEISLGSSGNSELLFCPEMLHGLGVSDGSKSFLLSDVLGSLGCSIFEMAHGVKEGEISKNSSRIFGDRGNRSDGLGGLSLLANVRSFGVSPLITV